MRTEDEIVINAPPETVYALAADIERWPDVLPHYRYVRTLQKQSGPPGIERRLVQMSAYRSFIPTVWTSTQERLPERREIRYRWVKGAARGMDVVWRMEPDGKGTRVTLSHELTRPRWWLRNPISSYILSHIFIDHIAGKTLAGIKTCAEGIE